MAKVDTNEDWKKFLKVVTTSIEEHPDPSFIDTVAVCLNVSQNYREWKARAPYTNCAQQVQYVFSQWSKSKPNANLKDLIVEFDIRLSETILARGLRAEVKSLFNRELVEDYGASTSEFHNPVNAYGDLLIQSGADSGLELTPESPVFPKSVSRSRMEGKAEEDWRIVVNLISEEKLDILGNPSPSSLAKHLRILEYYERYINSKHGIAASNSMKIRRILDMWRNLQPDQTHLITNFIDDLEKAQHINRSHNLDILIENIKKLVHQDISTSEPAIDGLWNEQYRTRAKTPRISEEMENQKSYLESRIKNVASLAAMDSYQLIFHLGGNIQGLNMSSNDLIIVSEMCLYRTTFELNKEQVQEPIIKFLKDNKQQQLSRGWSDIDYGQQSIDVNIDEILPRVKTILEENQNSKIFLSKTNFKHDLLKGILEKFVEIYSNSS